MEGLQLDEDLQLVIDLELRLLQPQVRASAGELETLLHPDFLEFGASGRSSIWYRTRVGWRLYFHQGTLIPEDQAPSPS